MRLLVKVARAIMTPAAHCKTVGDRIRTAQAARALVIGLLSFLATTSFAIAQSTTPAGDVGTFLITGATIIPTPGERLEHADLLIRDGRIEDLGPGLRAPADAVHIDGTGRYIYPGLIDSSTSIGLAEISMVGATRDEREMGDFAPHLRALSAVNAHSNLIPAARVNGIVAAITAPSGGIVSGQAALIRMDGWTWEELAVQAPAALVVHFPRPFRFASAPGTVETTQHQVEAQVRRLEDLFERAKAYAIRDPESISGNAPPDLALEAMRPVLNGEIPVLFHANTRDDILRAIEIADKYQLRMILAGAREAWRVADQLAEHDIPVILGSLFTSAPGGGPYDALFAQPAALHEAGIRFAFSTGSAPDVRNLPYHAATATAYGLDPDVALRALTVWPAEIWGVDDRLGALRIGKPANFFVSTGDPLDVRTNVEEVFIDGRRTSMDDRHSRLYQKFSERPQPRRSTP